MSRLPFELMLALRYLRPKRTFVSVITLISIIGVMLGVAVLIIVLSVMTGFDRELRDRILGFKAHLRIEPVDELIQDYRSLSATVSSNRHVSGVAPYVLGQVMVKTQPLNGNARVLAPVMRGVDRHLESTVSKLPSQIIRGEFNVRGNSVLVGSQFAAKMNVDVGDTLAIYSIRDLERMEKSWQENRKEGELKELSLAVDYEITGIFDVGYFEFNDLYIICSLSNAQDFYELGDRVQGLMVKLENADMARQVRRELASVLPAGLQMVTWEEDSAMILDAIMVEKNVMFYLLFFIMIVAAFGITSALITFVVQKTREIGILKAVGASGSQIMMIFVGQSLVVGILGVLAGFGLGMLGVSYRNEFLRLLRRATGFELFPAQIYNFFELPALIVPRDILVICGGSLLICVVAGVIPAFIAGRLKPVEALRHE